MLYHINKAWIICFVFMYFKIRVYQIASKNPPRNKTFLPEAIGKHELNVSVALALN